MLEATQFGTAERRDLAVRSQGEEIALETRLETAIMLSARPRR